MNDVLELFWYKLKWVSLKAVAMFVLSLALLPQKALSQDPELLALGCFKMALEVESAE